METLVQINPAEVRPIPLASESSVTRKCASPDCKWQFTEGKGFVPDRFTMYEQIRDSDVDSTKPLNRHEVLSMEFCSNCKRKFEQLLRMQMFPTVQALRQMDEWASENARAREIERREAQQREYEARKHAPHGSDRSFINQIFSEAKPHGQKHKKPGQRYMNANRPKREEKPKKDKSNKRH